MKRKKKILRHIFRFHGFAQSVRIAITGIGYLFVYHRNMRIIFLTGVAALTGGYCLGLNTTELAVLSITITLVFVAEIFNTAIEIILDISVKKYHTLIKLIKDIAAAVVLLTSINALVVGYILFFSRIF